MATILKGAPVVAAMNERNAALCEQLKANVAPQLGHLLSIVIFICFSPLV